MQRPLLTRDQALAKAKEDRCTVLDTFLDKCQKAIEKTADEGEHTVWVPCDDKEAGMHAVTVFKNLGYGSSLKDTLLLNWAMIKSCDQGTTTLPTATDTRARTKVGRERLVMAERPTVLDKCMDAIVGAMGRGAKGVGMDIKYRENWAYAADELHKLGYRTYDGVNAFGIEW